jgi:nitrate/nitrite transporter NarK
MIRLGLAAIAGYFTMISLVLLSDIVFEGAAAFSFVNLLLAFPYGFAGGWLAARIAREREITAGLWLGILAMLMGVVSYEVSPARQPVWYWTALTASLTAGAVVGSYRKFLSVQQSAPRKKKRVK